MTERELRGHLQALSDLVVSQHKETRALIESINAKIEGNSKRIRKQASDLAKAEGRLDALGKVVLFRQDVREACNGSGNPGNSTDVQKACDAGKRNRRIAG